MANRSAKQEHRTVFRSLDEIIKHFQPGRVEKDKNAGAPFAGLERVLTAEQFQRVRAELANTQE
jgi:hypothetical protein